MTSLQQTAMLGGAASAKVASYVLVAADAGDAITMSNAGATTITVNTGLFATGDIVTIINIGTGTCTITAGTATVTTSGSLVLAQNQGGVLRFTSPSAAIFLQFATPASGDIEGVTAGTGISGGGTSGTVTITNSMATEIAAKGDLIVGTGSATFDNLTVGANNTVLTADSSTATGLKWAASAGGSLAPYCSVNANATTITDNVATEVIYANENFDSDNAYNTSTGRFTPLTAGKYFVVTTLMLNANGVDIWHQGTNSIRKNGAEAGRTTADGFDNYANYEWPLTCSTIIECNGSTDYISTFATLNVTAGGTPQYGAGSRMTIFRIGA
jgi:hypothetical protein